MSDAHSSWAAVYDLVYERSFGEIYKELTDLTLSSVTGRLPQTASVVDFGAGTGRLSVPLAEMGYSVTAVEPCAAMRQQLEGKLRASSSVKLVDCGMQDFRGDGQHDGALCVFSVILYLLDENTLRQAFQAAAAALKCGGLLWLDVPGDTLFGNARFVQDGIDRRVEITPLGDGSHQYRESTTVVTEEGAFSYEDKFLIRHWPEPDVQAALELAGFKMEEDLSAEFVGTGSSYWLLRRI